MRSLRWTLPLASSISLFGASSALAVPTIQLTPQPTPLVTRIDTTGATYGCPERHSQTNSCIVDGTSQGVGYKDCIADTALQFSMSMTGVPDPNYSLQVWAGTTDCTAQGATNNQTTGTCWKVAADPQMAVTIPLFKVRVADIVSGLGMSPPVPQTYVANDATTSCNAAKAASSTTTVTDDAGVSTTTAGVATVTIYFMVFPASAATTPAATASYPVKVKLVGPNAVSNLTAQSGDGELILNWTPPSGDPTVQGFALYAVPQGTTIGDGGSTTTCNDASTDLLDDAGNPVLDDAGNPVVVPGDGGCTTTSTSSTATCNGTSGSVDVSALSCPIGGDAGGATNGPICEISSGVTTSKGTISGLTNNQTYVATVGAFDQYGNVGQIASAQCAQPLPIDDFWKIYNQDGGNAYCALEVVGKRGAPFAAALMALVGMIWIRRRRR